MSQENVELVRSAYEAWGKGDPEPVIEALDPEMEWDYLPYPLPDHAERGRVAYVEAHESRADDLRSAGTAE